jgi:hypothetical protein
MVWVNFKVFRLRSLFLVVLTEVEMICQFCNEPLLTLSALMRRRLLKHRCFNILISQVPRLTTVARRA